jgi:hypothetical protein
VLDKPTLVRCLIWDLDNTLWQGTLLEDPDVRNSARHSQDCSLTASRITP